MADINQVALQLAQEMIKGQGVLTNYSAETIAGRLLHEFQNKGAYGMLNAAYNWSKSTMHKDLNQSAVYQELVGQADELNKLRGGAEGQPAGSGQGVEDPAAARQALLDRFVQKMMGPLDPNDPEVQAVINNAGGAANRAAAGHGVHGGMATSNVAQATIDAQNQLMGQRHSAGLQATQLANNWVMGNKQFDADQEWKQYQATLLQNQNTANNRAAAISTGLSFVSPYIAQATGIQGLSTGIPKLAASGSLATSNPYQGLSMPGSGYTPSRPSGNN